MTDQVPEQVNEVGVPAEKEVRVVGSAKCPSVSNRSTISYDWGVDIDGRAMFRITANSGGGMFGRDWVPMNEVLAVLKDPANGDTISARAFREVFVGKSINTQSFLLAALRNEGVVMAHADKPRAYAVSELPVFEARMNTLGSASAEAVGEAKGASGKPDKRPVLRLKKKAASIAPVVKE